MSRRRVHGTAHKKRKEKQHAKFRAFERCGVILSNKDIEGLVKKIQKGQGTCLGKRSLSRSIWEVCFERDGEQTILRVMYNKERKTIMTVLPNESEEE